MAKIMMMARKSAKDKEAAEDAFLNEMADEMMKATGEDGGKEASETIEGMMEGFETMRRDAGISDVPMTPGPGLKSFMNPDEEDEPEGRYVLFSCEKNGFRYFFETEVSSDWETGALFSGLSLLRADGNGNADRYAGAGMWVGVDGPEYELPAEEAVMRLAGNGEGEAKLMEAFMNAEGRYPTEPEARRLLMRNGEIVRLIDDAGCRATVELVKGKAKAYLSSGNGEGMTFESAGAGRLFVGTALQAWSEDVPDAPELVTKIRLPMTYEETVETVKRAMKSRFFMPFSRDAAFAADYNPLAEAKRAKAELEALAEGTDDADAADEMRRVAGYAETYGRS